MFQRAQYKKLTDRVNEPRKFIQVVFGPRQVGKTTLVNESPGRNSFNKTQTNFFKTTPSQSDKWDLIFP